MFSSSEGLIFVVATYELSFPARRLRLSGRLDHRTITVGIMLPVGGAGLLIEETFLPEFSPGSPPVPNRYEFRRVARKKPRPGDNFGSWKGAISQF